MSVGLLFHYFDSKESLYEALVTIGVEGTKDAFSIPHEDPISFFYEVARVTLACLRRGALGPDIRAHGAGLDERVRPAIGQGSRQAMHAHPGFGPHHQEEQRAGSIRKGNALALSMAFWSSLQGIAESVAYEPETPLPDPDWIVDIMRAR
jgi:AcrR family transcriptional regulator